MSHTPGPWEWWTSNSWLRLTHKSDGDVLRPTIARDGHPQLAVSGDDQSLIAAAPELLKALINLKKLHVDLVECGDCGNWDVHSEPEIIAAKDAIDKAHGQE